MVMALYPSWLVLQRSPCPYPPHLSLLLCVVLSFVLTALGQSEPGHHHLSSQQGFVGTATQESKCPGQNRKFNLPLGYDCNVQSLQAFLTAAFLDLLCTHNNQLGLGLSI